MLIPCSLKFYSISQDYLLHRPPKYLVYTSNSAYDLVTSPPVKETASNLKGNNMNYHQNDPHLVRYSVLRSSKGASA